MTTTTLPDLEALEARRDDLYTLLCRNGGTPADWAECERLSRELRAKLCDRMADYARSRRAATEG
jgi:hypothetical protein